MAVAVAVAVVVAVVVAVENDAREEELAEAEECVSNREKTKRRAAATRVILLLVQR